MILALAGGVGGAKLASGLAAALPPEGLAIVVNTGDDFEHLGLRISPDLDTVMYTLAGLADAERGWGLAGESWAFMEALARLGGETWFRLGDGDMATHIERTRRLAKGESLTEVTARLAAALGIRYHLLPMSDAPVPTIVRSDEGVLGFQDYFVRRQCRPRVLGIDYAGGAPSAAFDAALGALGISAIIICPSNPVLSVGPILALRGIRSRLCARTVPVVAVSPIVGGKAVKGPAAANMRDLGFPVSAAGIAKWYGDLIDGLVIDTGDAPEAAEIGVPVLHTDIVMRTGADRVRLARETLAFAAGLGRRS